jgi:hypothetical protein
MNSVSDADIYNEFSLQHELGIKLREVFQHYNAANNTSFVVQFERNRSFFAISAPGIPKSEIDIVIYDIKANDKYAIELKFPLNGQVPMQMYKFLEDICFCEKLVDNGFNGAFAVTLANDDRFYEAKSKCDVNYPYCHFRQKAVSTLRTPIGSPIVPTGEKKGDKRFELKNSYDITWNSTPNIKNGKYYIVEI